MAVACSLAWWASARDTDPALDVAVETGADVGNGRPADGRWAGLGGSKECPGSEECRETVADGGARTDSCAARAAATEAAYVLSTGGRARECDGKF